MKEEGGGGTPSLPSRALCVVVVGVDRFVSASARDDPAADAAAAGAADAESPAFFCRPVPDFLSLPLAELEGSLEPEPLRRFFPTELSPPFSISDFSAVAIERRFNPNNWTRHQMLR